MTEPSWVRDRHSGIERLHVPDGVYALTFSGHDFIVRLNGRTLLRCPTSAAAKLAVHAHYTAQEK